MPIDRVWIYCLLFVCIFVCLFVCTVTDFCAKDKPSGVKFCMVVHRRPGHGISHLGELSTPEAPTEAQNGMNRPFCMQSMFMILVGSACVDIWPSAKTDVLFYFKLEV